MKFVKIVWLLSALVIFCFNASFEGVRIIDAVFGKYEIKNMEISKSYFNSSSRRRCFIVDGHVDEEKVYFSRFDDDIAKLFSLYPDIDFIQITNPQSIKVLKFENSRKVMLVADNEFKKWKTYILLSSLYSVTSIIIFISLRFKKVK